MSNSLIPSYVGALLNARDVYQYVYDRSGGYNTLSMLTNKINTKGSHRATNTYGLYEKYKRGKNNIVATVAAAPTQSGNNLILVFTDPNYDKFLPGDVVTDKNFVQGRVLVAGAGTVTIEPYPLGSAALVAATHFVAGGLCTFLFDASGSINSTGKGNRLFVPQQFTNYPSNTRESCTVARGEKFKTYVTQSGSEFGFWQEEIDMVDRFYKSIEFKYWFSQYGAPVSSSYQGVGTSNRGLRQAIMTDGVYMPISSSATATNLRDMLSALGNRNTMSGQRFTAFCGRDFLTNLQTNVTGVYIQYAGVRNTFGGEAVRGLNVMEYAIGDVMVDFIVAPILNDTDLSVPTTMAGASGTRWSNSCYLLNMDDVPSVGGGAMNPAIQKFHYGPTEVVRKCVTGMTGLDGDSTGGGSSNGWEFTSSDVDAFAVHIEGNMGIDVDGFRCGLIEPTT